MRETPEVTAGGVCKPEKFGSRELPKSEFQQAYLGLSIGVKDLDPKSQQTVLVEVAQRKHETKVPRTGLCLQA